MEFLRSSLRRQYAGKAVVASRNNGCFLRLTIHALLKVVFVRLVNGSSLSLSLYLPGNHDGPTAIAFPPSLVDIYDVVQFYPWFKFVSMAFWSFGTLGTLSFGVGRRPKPREKPLARSGAFYRPR